MDNVPAIFETKLTCNGKKFLLSLPARLHFRVLTDNLKMTTCFKTDNMFRGSVFDGAVVALKNRSSIFNFN